MFLQKALKEINSVLYIEVYTNERFFPLEDFSCKQYSCLEMT